MSQGGDFASRELPVAFERRRTRRHAIRCDCWLERDDTTLYGATADLCMGGLFLRTAMPLKPGSRFDVRMQVGNPPTTVVARGLVVRSILARNTPRYGVGIEFVTITQGRDALLAFLEDPVD